MTTLVFVRRFLSDYIRNPVNLLVLAVVPVVFVVVVAGSLSDFAKLLGGAGPAVATVTAAWAAAFVAGIAMYFQTATTRETDHRVVIAGLPAPRLVLSRLLTGLILAVLASATALVALAVRTGIDNPVAVIGGTLMSAVIYIAIGATVGVLARNPINGTVIVLFVWILDVFFGPAIGAADRVATRVLPSHFVTLWMADLPSGHSSHLADLGWALAWTLTAVLTSWVIVVTRTHRARVRVHRRTRARTGQLGAATQMAWRDARRNPAQWALFALVPVVFILGSEVVTPNKPIILNLEEHGRRIVRSLPMPDVHAATMAPLAVASLAALIGLFVLFDGRDSDHRVALAGLNPNALLGARLGVLALTALAATAASMATTALVFQATRWPTYVAANILIAITYALVGAWLAKIFGRVGGVFIAFLVPFLDIGIVQNPMLHPTPTTLSRWLPGYGASQVLIDGAFTSGFDQTLPLFVGLAWLVFLSVGVALTYRRAVRPAATRRLEAPRRHLDGAAAVRPSHVRAVQSGAGRVRTGR